VSVTVNNELIEDFNGRLSPGEGLRVSPPPSPPPSPRCRLGNVVKNHKEGKGKGKGEL